MSTRTAAQIAPLRSLADLIRLVEAHPSLAEPRRREMRSAINTIAKVMNAPPHMLPAAPAQLRDPLNRALPTAAGVSPLRFRNAKSLLRQAVALHCLQAIPARSQACLLPEWRVLLDAPEASGASLQRGLARLSKHCSRAGIPPGGVTQAVYDGFYEALQANCLMRSPRETQQAAGHAWNKAMLCVPGWPQVWLFIASHRRNPSLPWSAFPASLSEEVERYLTPRTAKTFSFSNPAPRLRASTISGKRIMLRQFATALVKTGRDPASLGSLADLVTLETVHAGLQVLWERMGCRDSSHTYNVAYMLYGIAKHWLKLPAAAVTALKVGCKEIRPLKDGMTRKNRLRLQQFDDPANLRALLELPAKMMEEACDTTRRSKAASKPTKAEARLAQQAVAIEFLLMVPLRVKNVSELELGRTLFFNGKTGHVLINEDEVKNNFLVEAPLSKEFCRLLGIYLNRFHGLLAPPGCKMLFPSADGGHKRTPVLSHQLSTYIARRCGLEVNAHLFRHLCGKLYNEANPGAYGVIRMLLGHKDINTTINTYCGTEFAQAFRQYDSYVTGLRGGGSKLAAKASSKQGRR